MDLGAPRFQAWLQIILGAGLLIVGLGTLVDSSSSRIYLGAIVIGPIMVFRGIRLLNAVAEVDAQKPAGSDFSPASAAGIARDLLDPLESPTLPANAKMAALDRRQEHVVQPCLACDRPYVYFPAVTIVSQVQYECLKHSAAPCPRCGHVQFHMIDLNGEFTANWQWTEKFYFLMVGLGIGSAGFLAFNLNKFYGAGAQPDSLEPIYWYSNLGVLLAAVCCAGIYLYGMYRRRDPNNGPLAMRLERGVLLGMPLEEYEELAQTANSPLATGIQEERVWSVRPRSGKPDTGIQDLG